MARQRNSGLDDNALKELVSRWLNGEKLTAQEEKVIGGLVRQYPSLAQLKINRQKQAAGRQQPVSRVDPNVTRSLQNRGTRFGSGGGQVVSPGGFKSSGRDEASALRRSGTMTPEELALRNVELHDGGKGGAEYNVGNVHRRYSKAQVDAILARGASGATLGQQDQAIYDAILQHERRVARSVQRENDNQQAEVAAADYQRRLEEGAKAAQQRALELERQKADLALEKENRKAQAKAEEEALKRQNDRDAKLDGLLMGGNYAYSKEQERRMREIQSEQQNILDNPEYSEVEAEEMIRQLQDKFDAIYYRPQRVINTAEKLRQEEKERREEEREQRKREDEQRRLDEKDRKAEEKERRESERSEQKIVWDLYNNLLKEQDPRGRSSYTDEQAMEEAKRRRELFLGTNAAPDVEPPENAAPQEEPAPRPAWAVDADAVEASQVDAVCSVCGSPTLDDGSCSNPQCPNYASQQ